MIEVVSEQAEYVNMYDKFERRGAWCVVLERLKCEEVGWGGRRFLG